MESSNLSPCFLMLKMRQLFLLLLTFLTLNGTAMALIDSSATTETQALYSQLQSAQGNYIYFGQHFWGTDPSNSDSFQITGKHPYFIEETYKLGWRSDPATTTFNNNVKSYLQAHYNNGGFVGINIVIENFVTDGGDTDLTGDPFNAILAGGSHRAEYLIHLDDLATCLTSLTDSGGTLIPVIFRPYHENDGWWSYYGRYRGFITVFSNAGSGLVTITSNGHPLVNGNSVVLTGTTNYNGTYTISNVTSNTFDITAVWVSDDATGRWTIDHDAKFKTQWQDLITYLRDTKGVHNVIYCYSIEWGTTHFFYDSNFEIRYPGNDYADIIGIDYYPDISGGTDNGTVQNDALQYFQVIYDEASSRDKLF